MKTVKSILEEREQEINEYWNNIVVPHFTSSRQEACTFVRVWDEDGSIRVWLENMPAFCKNTNVMTLENGMKEYVLKITAE